jgi:hypothetical protein
MNADAGKPRIGGVGTVGFALMRWPWTKQPRRSVLDPRSDHPDAPPLHRATGEELLGRIGRLNEGTQPAQGELAVRHIRATEAAAASADRASDVIAWLTAALVLLTLVLIGLTVVLIVKA